MQLRKREGKRKAYHGEVVAGPSPSTRLGSVAVSGAPAALAFGFGLGLCGRVSITMLVSHLHDGVGFGCWFRLWLS